MWWTARAAAAAAGASPSAGGDGQRALARRRQHQLGRQPLADAVAEAEPQEPRRGEQDGGPLRVRVELGKPGVHVATDVANLEVRPEMKELRPPAETAGREDRALGQVAPRNRPAAHERVTWILALAHGHQRDTVRQPGGQILEGVHREIDPPLQHRVVDLPGEEGAAADLRERHVLHHVARGANLDPYRLVPGGVEPRPHVLRLPERERARPRTDAERRAHRPPDPAAAGSAATRAAASSPEAIASPSATPSR